MRDLMKYKKKGTPRELLEFRYTVDPNTGCWVFKNKTFNVPTFGLYGKHVNARRVAYELEVGKLQPGIYLYAKCENPQCISPAHMDLVFRDEIPSRLREIQRKRGTRPGPIFKKLSVEAVANIHALRKEGKKLREIAAVVGVDLSLVGRIVKGERMAYLKPVHSSPSSPTK